MVPCGTLWNSNLKIVNIPHTRGCGSTKSTLFSICWTPPFDSCPHLHYHLFDYLYPRLRTNSMTLILFAVASESAPVPTSSQILGLSSRHNLCRYACSYRRAYD